MTDQTRSTSLESLRLERFVPASPERVFRAWTTPEELKRWWGPANVRCLSAEVDLRVGGGYRIENQLPDGKVLWIAGEFEKIERPHLLIYTWTVETGGPSVERVTARFDTHDQGTMVTLDHERIETPTLRDQHRAGWLGCLDGLMEFLSAVED